MRLIFSSFSCLTEQSRLPLESGGESPPEGSSVHVAVGVWERWEKLGGLFFQVKERLYWNSDHRMKIQEMMPESVGTPVNSQALSWWVLRQNNWSDCVGNINCIGMSKATDLWTTLLCESYPLFVFATAVVLTLYKKTEHHGLTTAPAKYQRSTEHLEGITFQSSPQAQLETHSACHEPI